MAMVEATEDTYGFHGKLGIFKGHPDLVSLRQRAKTDTSVRLREMVIRPGSRKGHKKCGSRSSTHSQSSASSTTSPSTSASHSMPHFFVIRHDQRHGMRPQCHSGHNTPHSQDHRHPSPLRAQVTTRKAGDWLCRSPESDYSPWCTFRGIGGGDESLIQATARQRGRLSTGFLRSWFSLYPTTRHHPLSTVDHGAQPLF